MSTNTTRLTSAFERYLPLIIIVGILLFAFFWFIQPPLTAYVASRGEVTSLEARLQTLQDTIRQGQAEPPADSTAVLQEFESRTAEDDKVADVVEFLVRTATASTPKGQFRALQVTTAEMVRAQETDRGRRGSSRIGEGPDPRFELFPVALSHTPVTISFESSFEGIAEFVWRLRNMPTMVEIRSLELTRGLPLMKAELTVFVYQRGRATSGQGVPQPPEVPSPAVPRVAMLDPADEGR
ncbi:MAG: hypothetical protein AB1806_16325 [Acidobacteriota bacterium]